MNEGIVTRINGQLTIVPFESLGYEVLECSRFRRVTSDYGVLHPNILLPYYLTIYKRINTTKEDSGDRISLEGRYLLKIRPVEV